MLRVSAIIPTYNRAQLVTHAIESVLNQSFQDFEVIVVDDGSIDDTGRILQRYKNKVRYIYQENAGVGSARNHGIELANGEWLAFLDSDDEWHEDYLLKQLRLLESNPGLCVQISDCHYTGLNGNQNTYFEMNRVLSIFKSGDYVIVKNPFCFVTDHAPWQIGAAIFRRDAVKNAGAFDENLRISEDFDFMARMSLQGSLGLIREPLVNIYRRNENITCLSELARSHPIVARESDERMYQKLLENEKLTRRERRALNRTISANKRAIGNLLLRDGKKKEARERYRHAVSIHPSIRSFGKYLVSLPRTSSRRAPSPYTPQ